MRLVLCLCYNVIHTDPTTAAALANYGGILRSQGQLQRAHDMLSQSVVVLAASIGADAPFTMTARGNLESLERELEKQKGLVDADA